MPLSITQRISARSRSRSAQLVLFTSFVPPSRQLSFWNLRDRFAGFVVVRRVVEQREPRAGCVPKIDNVQRGRFLVEIVSISSWIKPKQRTEQKADGRFVRDDQNIFARMLAHQLDQWWQRARRHRQSAFAPHRSKCVRVLLPLR